MDNLLIAFAMLYVAYHEACFVYKMDRVGIAHTKSVTFPFCLTVLFSYNTPRIIEQYLYSGRFLLIGSLMAAQAILAAVVAYIVALRFDRYVKARKRGKGQ